MVSGSGGFSSANPFRAKGPQVDAGTYTRRYGGGGGRSEAPGARAEIERQQAEKAAQEKAAQEQKAREEAARQQAEQQAQERQRLILLEAKRQEQLKQQQVTSQEYGNVQQQYRQSVSPRPSIAIQVSEKIKKTTGVDIKQAGSRVKETIAPAYNVVTGRSLDVKRVSKEQEKLNKEVEEFNLQYGNRELSEKEFASAEAKSLAIEERQAKIDTELSEIQASTSYRLVDTISGRKFERQVEESGGKLYTGSLPIIPAASVPTAVTGIRFAGTQTKTKEGAELVKLSFKTSTGRQGVAQAIVKQDGEVAKSIIGSQSAQKAISFPSGKIRLTKVDTAIGLERAKSVPVSQAELQGQLSAGRVISSGSKKLPIAGKSKPTEFVSASLSKQQGDLNFVFGKAFTREGAKARFGGVIKKVETPETFSFTGGSSTVTKTSPVVKELLSTVASSEAKQTGAGTFKFTSSLITKPSTPSPSMTKQETTLSLPKLSVKPKEVQTPKIITSTTTRPTYRTSGRTNILTQTKQVTKQKVDTAQKIIPKQNNLQAQRLGLRQQQILKQTQTRYTAKPFAPPTIKTFKGFGFRLPKGSDTKQPRGIFGVEVRRQGVFRNVGSARTLQGALNLGRSRVSNTLAASFRVTGTGGKAVPLPKGFGRSKRESDVIVEKRSQRLSTGSEIFEIQTSKKRKTRRKKK